ncbi:Uncharacterized protein Rs2_20764 [Raphanus sativus]|nr:Uncharacterized protein Rs2_20764 [Raphanus sativus]
MHQQPSVVWHTAIIPKHSTNAWLFLLNRNPTLLRIKFWNLDIETTALTSSDLARFQGDGTLSFTGCYLFLRELHLQWLPTRSGLLCCMKFGGSGTDVSMWHYLSGGRFDSQHYEDSSRQGHCPPQHWLLLRC